METLLSILESNLAIFWDFAGRNPLSASVMIVAAIAFFFYLVSPKVDRIFDRCRQFVTTSPLIALFFCLAGLSTILSQGFWQKRFGNNLILPRDDLALIAAISFTGVYCYMHLANDGSQRRQIKRLFILMAILFTGMWGSVEVHDAGLREANMNDPLFKVEQSVTESAAKDIKLRTEKGWGQYEGTAEKTMEWAQGLKSSVEKREYTSSELAKEISAVVHWKESLMDAGISAVSTLAIDLAMSYIAPGIRQGFKLPVIQAGIRATLATGLLATIMATLGNLMATLVALFGKRKALVAKIRGNRATKWIRATLGIKPTVAVKQGNRGNQGNRNSKSTATNRATITATEDVQLATINNEDDVVALIKKMRWPKNHRYAGAPRYTAIGNIVGLTKTMIQKIAKKHGLA